MATDGLLDSRADRPNRYPDAINQCNWSGIENCFDKRGVRDIGGPEAGAMAMCFEGPSQLREGITATFAAVLLCAQRSAGKPNAPV